MAENLFLKSPSATGLTATAPVAPPMPAINTLPARSSSAGPLTSSAATVMSKGLLPPPDLQPLFEKYSAEYGVPLNVVSALAQQESGYNANAVGEQTKWGQAKGMLQNLDSNAKALGIDPFNAEQAIAGAARQMRERLDKGYSMEDAVKAHFGGDNRKQWGEKTQAYGQEVLAKASIIGDQLMAGKKPATPSAPGNDLAAIQAEMDAKEPGRYKVIDPADIAQRDQQRADIASGKDAVKNAQADAGGYDAPSPYTLENQQRIEDKVNAAPGLSPLTTKNQALTKAGFAPVADQPQDGFVAATKKSLQNLPEHFKNAAGGIIRTQGEGIDDQTLVSNAENAGIIQRMQDNGDIIMVQDERGQMTPTLRDGTNGDTSSLAKYLRKHARDLMTPEEAGALVGMKPSDITQLGKRLSKEANADTVQINPDGPLAKYGSMIIGSTAEMIPAIAASVITKNPAVGMSMIGGQVYGQSYDAARQKNLNPNDAATYAMAQAAAEAIPEALPIHVIMQPGQQFFKGLLKAGAAEALQETVTQAIQSGLDKGSIDPKMTWAQAREQIADAAIVGAGTGAALKAGVHGIQKAVDAIPTRDREAEAAAAAQAQAEPAPAAEAQQTPAPEAATVTPEPAPAPTGPLTRAAQQFVAPEPPAAPAEAAPTGEPVTVRSSDGEMAGTLEDYQDHGRGQWTARVLADDGNAYEFTQDDGVQLEREGQPATPVAEPVPAAPSIPITGKVGKIPTLTDVVKPGVEIPTLTEEVPTLTDVVEIPTLTDIVEPEAQAAPDYSSMDMPKLRTELKAIATAIKADPKNKALTKQRSTIEKAIKANVENAISKPAVAELVGDQIDKEWSRFADDSGSLNIPRADMPQIKAEHRGAMVNFLNARGIEHAQEEVPASSLKPTQEEFSPAKVKKALGFEGGDRSILISSDNHVLDGHHQWLAKVDGDQPVKVIRLDAPIKQLLADVREFPSATTANGATEAKPTVETKPVKPASEVPKTATPAAEPALKAAKPASKPLTPQQKAKARKEGKQAKTREALGVNVDDQFTLGGADVGYSTPGETYTLTEIGSDGTAYVTNSKGSSTSWSPVDIMVGKRKGSTFTPTEKANTAPAMEEPVAPAETAKELVKAAEYGASNKLVSTDRAAELRAKLKAKLNGSQLNSGIDPEILAMGTELAVFHIEAGVRKFADFAKTMAEDLGQPLEKVRPYLRSWFNGARDMMEDAGHSVAGMDNADTVRAELAKLGQAVAPQTAHATWLGKVKANGAVPIQYNGEQWLYYPGSPGTVREDGQQFTHMIHPTEGKEAKNGWSPRQASDYVDRDGKATEAKIATVQTVTTPSGREFDVRAKVVEADSLITSNTADGAVNPDYPAELQPRDRSRSASLDQINDIASKLNPRLLGDSASATDGAPIVSLDGVVESGNGRTLGIQQAYAKNTDGAQKYRAWLESQGHDVASMKAPILVRERVTPMTTEELQAYTTEANERTTLALSSTERAVADAKKMGGILHLFNGGDVAGAANREFVRAFMGDVASKSDRGSLMDGDGVLSQDGRRRIEAALLAAAYDDPALVNDIFESADSDIKSIGGALLDAAGPWAQMRRESADGQISKAVDVTPNLMEAVNLVRQARAQGKSMLEMVNQNDMFSGTLDQATKDWVSVFYRGANLARARGRDKVADALLTYTQLARATQPGTNLFGEPELTGADLIRGTHDQLDRQEAQATQQQGLFGDAKPDDQSAGARRADGQRPAPGARSEAPPQGSEVNAASTGERVERNRTDATAPESVDETAVSDEPAAAGRRTGEPGASDVESRADGQRDQRLPADGAATGRESGDQRVHQPDGAFRPTVSVAGGAERARSGGDRVAGEPVEQERAEHIVDTAPATDASEFSERLAAQKKATGTKTVRGDKANIDAALPLLLDPQRDDVLKAEQRFAVGNGMLLTNGTGTGKTASGMGVIVRSINAGKPNALVVVPSDKIASDWIKFAKMLGVELKLLDSTSDNGKDGQVITTYANFGANDSLALRDWDQVVADEAHYLSSNEAGEGTGALARLQALTGHHDGFYQWVRQRNAKAWGAYKAAMNASRDAAVPDSGFTQTQKDQLAEAEAEQKAAWNAIEQPAKKAWQARWASQQDLPKTLFLSATPFAYVKSVDYAEGYLFDYVSPAERYSNKAETEGAGYNSGDAREKFFMQHFGYRMRYNKLTAPEAGVDSELMEQNFNQHLKEVGALSGRRLEVPYDYDRKFVMVDDAVGQKIDQGLAFLREHEDGKYREVYKAVMDTFDYQRRMYLLESIKARAVVPMIKEHMKLGRKVVVFHDYNKGGGFDPFQAGLSSITDPDVKAFAREAFAARPDIFKKMDLKGLFSPIDTLSAAFPDALFFNGTVPKAKRRANADTFNDDVSGKDLIVLQSDAGREGVSLHDTSGQHMRVLINLGMPGKPVAAIQIEGRTYRTGQASDAAFRYLTTGTAWEASAFASKIAERASTAENLALGTDARGLKQSFIDAYNNAEDLAPGAEDGKGGKAIDRELAANAALTPFQKAKSYYFAQQKNSKRRDQREGVDYFATPEPVGFKMAEWANIQKGDDVLEPSAGHGAIARFFPPQTTVTMVEPSYDLSQRAALANGNARIINDTFEALHLTNKYDAIVMNPPYGNGGKTAIEHVAKAAKHLREGGRIVALIPRGVLTDKRLATFLESDEAQILHRVATFTMPAATFERAGTSVNTQVIVLEKHSNPDDAQAIHARTINLDNAESTGELFDRIEHLDLPDRTPSSKPEVKPVMIEHITGKGKTLTGIVRTDLTKAEAKEIDAFTFAKDGGWFIRAKHLGDGNRLSVATPVGEPASHQEVRDAITEGPFGNVIKKLIDSGNIVVHGNVQSLPDGANVRGVQAVTTPDGKVHLVAANLTPGNANAVLLHEMFHSGGETLVGSQRWAALIKRLDGLQRQAEQSTGKARAVFDLARERVQIAQRQGGVADGMTAEEFGAYAIEEYEQLPKAFRTWVDDLVGAIKHWLFSRYGKQLGQVTPAQLRAMAKDALVSMALAKRGELFGPAGTMLSATAQTNTPAFKRWFGNSKVVDAKGEPLVVYHGTPNDFAEFLPGAYFTEHPQEAGAYTGASATMARDRMTGKFTIGSDSGKSDGANVRYAYDGLTDLESPQVGEVVATDDLAYRYDGGGKWTVFNDLEPDFSADASDNDHVMVQKADTSESATERVAEYEEAVVRSTPGGDGGGNVRPVYLSIENPIRLSALEGNRLAQKAGNDREYIANQISKWEAQGYDGIVTESDEASNIPESREGLGGIPQQWVAFRPEQVKSAIGNNGEFDPSSPDIRYSVRLADVFDDIKNDADATSFSDKIGPEKLPQRMADRWRQLTDNLALRFRQAAVDRYAPLMRNDQALYGADTLEGSIASSSWVLARMSQAAGGAVDAMLNHGRIYLDPAQKVIDLHDNSTGLKDTLKKLGGTAEMTRFMGWIAANRSKRLLGEGRENLFTPAEIEAGIKFSGGRLADGRSRSMLYQQVWKEFQQHRDDVLGIAEQAGIITPEQRTTWSNEFYVPFYRVIDSENLGGPKSGGGGLSRQQAFKKLKGGRQHLNDLLENTLLNFHHLVQASLKNQAAAQAMENAEQLGIADKTTEAHRDKKASTFVMENGEKQWYNVSDPLTFKAVSAITDAGVNTLSRRIMRGFKRFFTNMTTITPQFVVANAIRDTLSAMATSPTSAIPLKNAFQGAFSYGNKHKRARMMASGGAFHFGQAYGQGANEFKASLNGTMRTAQVLKDPMLIPNTLMKAWRKYHEVTDFAENMNRAGIWENNLDKGKLKAAFEARDLMDFSAHGDAGIIRFFTDVVPFLNARIQGLDKLYRSGGKPTLKVLFGKGTKSDKQAFARFAAVVGALTAFSVMLYLRNKDDEDYRKLEDWQRDTYWVIKIGGNMFFIPKPFEVGSIATMGERLMEQFVDPTVGGDKLASRALHMLSDTFAMNPTPQAIKPVLELGYNENTFTGRPIEDQSMTRLSPSLRARPDTTRLAEASSRGIESALDVIGARNSALSPVQIDHLIQGYLGAVGSTAIGMADTFWRGAQGEELPARSWDEYQPVKRFYKDLTKEANYTRYGTDFYNALKKSDQAYADLQHLAKYGEEEKAVALEGKQADVLALRGTLNKVNRDMSRINAEMKRIQVDKDMDGGTKRLELDRLRSMRNLMTEEIGKDLEQQKTAKRASEGQ